MKRPVYLMGLMASGKTKLGRQLAPKLGLPFLDLDHHIETLEQTTIADLFKVNGELFFRLLEHKYLFSLIDEQPHVVSLGGGTPCTDQNIGFIKETGYSVYLKVPIPILVSRLQAQQQQRPLLQNVQPDKYKDVLEDQLKNREQFYSQADLTIENDGSLSAAKLAETIKVNLG